MQKLLVSLLILITTISNAQNLETSFKVKYKNNKIYQYDMNGKFIAEYENYNSLPGEQIDKQNIGLWRFHLQAWNATQALGQVLHQLMVFGQAKHMMV